MIGGLAQCIREYKKPAILAPLAMAGEVTMEVLIPLVMADLYDYGIKLQDMGTIIVKSLLLVLCTAASLVFGILSAKCAARAGTGFAKNLHHDMYYHVQDFSFSNIDHFSSASIVTRLTSDVANLQTTFQMMIRIAIRCPMMLILSLVSANRTVCVVICQCKKCAGGGRVYRGADQSPNRNQLWKSQTHSPRWLDPA